MGKTLTLLCALLVWTQAGHAIENLTESPTATGCEQRLGFNHTYPIGKDLTITLNSNQILVRGQLEAYLQPGGEGSMSWALLDDFFERKILPEAWDALYFLKPGDQLFILNEDGQRMASGYFQEGPQLTLQSEGGLSAVPMDELRRLFHQRARAVLVRTLTADEKRELAAFIKPKLERHAQHLQDPGRFKQVSPTLTIDLAAHETMLSGEFHYELSQVPTQSITFDALDMADVTDLPPSFVIRPSLITPNGAISLTEGDELLLLDKEGRLLDRELMTSAVIAPSDEPGFHLEDIVARLKNATQAILIRKQAPPSAQ